MDAARTGAASILGASEDEIGERPDVDLVAAFLCILDSYGIGGCEGVEGRGTIRVRQFRALGKGRKQASDGGAWGAAINAAGHYLTSWLMIAPEGDRIALWDGEARDLARSMGRDTDVDLQSLLHAGLGPWLLTMARDGLRSGAAPGAWADLVNRVASSAETPAESTESTESTARIPDDADRRVTAKPVFPDDSRGSPGIEGKGDALMIAYHGDPRLKAESVARAHCEADQIARGADPWVYERELGIPAALTGLAVRLLGALPRAAARPWLKQFLETISVGADLSRVGLRVLAWLLTEEVPRHFDAAKWPQLGAVVAVAARMYRRAAAGTHTAIQEWEWEVAKDRSRAVLTEADSAWRDARVTLAFHRAWIGTFVPQDIVLDATSAKAAAEAAHVAIGVLSPDVLEDVAAWTMVAAEFNGSPCGVSVRDAFLRFLEEAPVPGNPIMETWQMPKPSETRMRQSSDRHVMTVAMSAAHWAELAALCKEEAVRCGGNPDRLRTPVIRRLIHSAYLALGQERLDRRRDGGQQP